MCKVQWGLLGAEPWNLPEDKDPPSHGLGLCLLLQIVPGHTPHPAVHLVISGQTPCLVQHLDISGQTPPPTLHLVISGQTPCLNCQVVVPGEVLSLIRLTFGRTHAAYRGLNRRRL